jgi:cell division cycle protein 20 (cofactor of APC complex)
MENIKKKSSSQTTPLEQRLTHSVSLANISNFALKSTKLNDNSKKSSKPNLKTPIKAQLQLSNKKKHKTQNDNIINDRYIPNRISENQMEMSYHLMNNNNNNNANIANNKANINNANTSNNNDQSAEQSESLTDDLKRRLIIDTCNGIPEKTKVLNLHNRPHYDGNSSENLSSLYSHSLINNYKKATTRIIPNMPDRILDAPDYRDDYYLNLIDWSKSNNLAVALNKDMYIWNSDTGDISMLFGMSEDDSHYISSTGWIDNMDNFLAVGNSKGHVEIWDADTQTRIREMKSENAIGRVGAISWNEHIISNGSRCGEIHHHDVRIKEHHVGTFKQHEQEVCGLKWSPDGRHLASGGNDNLVMIWDMRISHVTRPALHVLSEHLAAVKAVSWCPWQSNILATGGGTADAHIKLWNVYNGSMLQSVDAKSQISCILWSNHYKELITSHGFSQNQLSIWKYPEMTKVAELTGHSNRVLMMAMSPDEEMIASAGADETLRLWKCFAVDKRKESKTAFYLGDKSSFSSLSMGIR